MNTKKLDAGAVQNGPTSIETNDNLPDPSIANIKKWAFEDLNRAISLLDAIRKDDDLLLQMATWFHGRIENEKLKAQNGRFDNGKERH